MVLLQMDLSSEELWPLPLLSSHLFVLKAVR